MLKNIRISHAAVGALTAVRCVSDILLESCRVYKAQVNKSFCLYGYTRENVNPEILDDLHCDPATQCNIISVTRSQ